MCVLLERFALVVVLYQQIVQLDIIVPSMTLQDLALFEHSTAYLVRQI